MKDKRLKIIINQPSDVVFNFTLDPKNTPKWIDGIEQEITSEWPVKIGSTYRNQGSNGDWNEYELVDIEKDKTFTLSQKNGDYSVRYTFDSQKDNSTEFEYYEWVDTGELDDTVSQKTLEKLKEVIESEK